MVFEIVMLRERLPEMIMQHHMLYSPHIISCGRSRSWSETHFFTFVLNLSNHQERAYISSGRRVFTLAIMKGSANKSFLAFAAVFLLLGTIQANKDEEDVTTPGNGQDIGSSRM